MISREELLTQLRAMPSSLNDACRTMELAADFISCDSQQALFSDEQLDRAAFRLFLLDNNASRWPSVNQDHYRKEAKSILDAAFSSTPGQAIEKTEGETR